MFSSSPTLAVMAVSSADLEPWSAVLGDLAVVSQRFLFFFLSFLFTYIPFCNYNTYPGLGF